MPKDTMPPPSKAAGREPDQLFSAPRERIDDFNFGADTTVVFDDMLDRSVPFYGEIERMIGELAGEFVTDGTRIYDLGCSTGRSALEIARVLPRERRVSFVGIDSSPEMLELADKKLRQSDFPFPFELRHGDLNEPLEIEDASVVLLVLTLQFVRPLRRDPLVSAIYRGMAERSCLLLVEKVLGESSTFNRMFIKHYYEMKKRHGYSELEIAQKREALENVLIPYRLTENLELLRRCGFQQTEVFFKWYNFCGIVAMK